jgi:hypothetical protein
MPSVKIEQSFLHDICENPDDDTPRLAFADGLDLSFGDLGDVEVRALLACPWLAFLTHFELRQNDIGAAGARALANSPHLDNLVHLDLSNNPITGRAAGLLRERFGDRVELYHGV